MLAYSDLNFHKGSNVHDYIFTTVNFLAKFAKIWRRENFGLYGILVRMYM